MPILKHSFVVNSIINKSTDAVQQDYLKKESL